MPSRLTGSTDKVKTRDEMRPGTVWTTHASQPREFTLRFPCREQLERVVLVCLGRVVPLIGVKAFGDRALCCEVHVTRSVSGMFPHIAWRDGGLGARRWSDHCSCLTLA